MEVSGKRKERKSFSASRGSAEDFLLFCIPCDSEGVRVPAHGYCKNCKEHLCGTCFKHHRKPAPSRNHVLLDKDLMPKVPSVSTKQDDFDHCPEHVDEKLKFYCRDHSKIACGVCVPLDHRTCQVEYIPKLSKNILEGDELNSLIAELTTFQDACKSKIQKANENIKASEQNHQQLLKEIKHFREELNAFLDEMELRITKEVDCVMNAHKDVVKKSSADLEDIRKEIEVYKSRLESLKQENHLDKLFIEMKTTQKQFEEISIREIASSAVDEIFNWKFVGNKSILELLQSQKEIGNLIQAQIIDLTEKKRQDSELSTTSTPSEDKTVLLEYVDEIDVQSQSDVKTIGVTGLESIKPDRLVICDRNNCKVKCYDTVKRKIVSEIKLENYPFDVTAITDKKIAVNATGEAAVMIYLMSVKRTSITTDKKINVNKECRKKINVNKECRGIAYSQGKLIVSWGLLPGKVSIINLKGEILQTFLRETFYFPEYITTNSAGTYIYICGLGSKVKAVQKLDLLGHVVNEYKTTELSERTYLQGLCELDDGTILVCLGVSDENNIVRLSSTCKPCKVSGHEQLGSCSPRAVTYCKKSRMLYVSFSEEEDLVPSSRLKEDLVPSSRIKTFRVDWR